MQKYRRTSIEKERVEEIEVEIYRKAFHSQNKDEEHFQECVDLHYMTWDKAQKFVKSNF